MLEMSFAGWLKLAAVTPARFSSETGVSLRTIRRWESTHAPRMALEYLRLRYAGIPCGPRSKWNGWRFRPDADVLLTPADVEIGPGDILAIPFLHGAIAALRRELETPCQRSLL